MANERVFFSFVTIRWSGRLKDGWGLGPGAARDDGLASCVIEGRVLGVVAKKYTLTFLRGE